MIRQRPADFKAAEEMADSQNMLAILDNFHIDGFNVRGSGFWVPPSLGLQSDQFDRERNSKKAIVPAGQWFVFGARAI
jgi:hypothetical protein